MVVKRHGRDNERTAERGPIKTAGLGTDLKPLDKWEKPAKGGKVCTCCGAIRKPYSFPPVPRTGHGFCDQDGIPRFHVCKECLPIVLEKFTKEDPDHNKYKALYRLCAISGIYYSDELAHKVFEEEIFYEDGTPANPNISRVEYYFRVVADDVHYCNKFFYETNNVQWDAMLMKQGKTEDLDRMSEQTKKARASIITTYHRDPFENESFDDRVQMYEDLLTMTTADVGENLPKARALIEIVKAYNRIDKINATLNTLQESVDSMLANDKAIKTLTDNKDKEMKGIANLCKDYNLSDKHASSGNKGLGTIGSVVREMADKNYDPGRLNRFDVDTAAAMQQVADISMESIFHQLNFTSADFAAIVRKQAGVIRDMQATMEAQGEELRLLKEQHIKQELLEEYANVLKERGIDSNEIQNIIRRQMEFKPYDTTAYYAPTDESEGKSDNSDNEEEASAE